MANVTTSGKTETNTMKTGFPYHFYKGKWTLITDKK